MDTRESQIQRKSEKPGSDSADFCSAVNIHPYIRTFFSLQHMPDLIACKCVDYSTGQERVGASNEYVSSIYESAKAYVQ